MKTFKSMALEAIIVFWGFLFFTPIEFAAEGIESKTEEQGSTQEECYKPRVCGIWAGELGPFEKVHRQMACKEHSRHLYYTKGAGKDLPEQKGKGEDGLNLALAQLRFYDENLKLVESEEAVEARFKLCGEPADSPERDIYFSGTYTQPKDEEQPFRVGRVYDKSTYEQVHRSLTDRMTKIEKLFNPETGGKAHEKYINIFLTTLKTGLVDENGEVRSSILDKNPDYTALKEKVRKIKEWGRRKGSFTLIKNDNPADSWHSEKNILYFFHKYFTSDSYPTDENIKYAIIHMHTTRDMCWHCQANWGHFLSKWQTKKLAGKIKLVCMVTSRLDHWLDINKEKVFFIPKKKERPIEGEPSLFLMRVVSVLNDDHASFLSKIQGELTELEKLPQIVEEKFMTLRLVSAENLEQEIEDYLKTLDKIVEPLKAQVSTAVFPDLHYCSDGKVDLESSKNKIVAYINNPLLVEKKREVALYKDSQQSKGIVSTSHHKLPLDFKDHETSLTASTQEGLNKLKDILDACAEQSIIIQSVINPRDLYRSYCGRSHEAQGGKEDEDDSEE